jgi:cyanophycinase
MGHTRGALFLVGGAADKVFADFVRLAGGPSAHIAILTHASEVPQKRADEISASLRQCGVSRITVLMPEHATLPQDVDAVFISGGDQNRLVELLDKNGLAQQVRDANRRGVLVAGTSAGAACVAYVMMAGNTDDWDKDILKLGTVLLGKGLCLQTGIVVDTHFGNRNRQGRLRVVLGMLDDIVGIGLDEDTAAYIVGDQVEVFGVGKVRIYTRGAGSDFDTIAKNAVETTYSAGDKFAL